MILTSLSVEYCQTHIHSFDVLYKLHSKFDVLSFLPFKVIPHEVIELDVEDDTDGVMIIGESTSDYKNKQPVGYDNSWQKQVKVLMLNKWIFFLYRVLMGI